MNEQQESNKEPSAQQWLAAVPAILIGLDGGGRIVHWSAQAEAAFGLTSDEVSGRPLDRCAVAWEWDAIAPALARCRADRQAFSLDDVRFRTRQGECGVLTVTLTPVKEGDDEGILLLATDATEHRRAEGARRESEERLHTVVTQAPVFLFAVDCQGMFTLFEGHTLEALGLMAGQAVGWSVFELYEHVPAMLADVRRALAGHEVSGTYDFADLAFETHLSPMWDSGGQVIGATGVATDVTQRRRAEEALAQSERRFRSLVQNSSDIVTVLDPQGHVLYESPSLEHILGHARETQEGDSLLALIHPEDAPSVEKFFAEVLAQPGVHPAIEFRVRHRDGTWRHLEAISSNQMADPSVQGIVVNSRDITERKAFQDRLRHQAFYDVLTGLPNRALFLDRLTQALAGRRRRKRAVGVIFLDLDNFKVINDSLGHGAGDELLRAAAMRMEACLRPGDTLARLGGDEFTVLIPDTADGDQALGVARRLSQALQAPIQLQGRDVFVTASLGVAVSTVGGERPDDLLRAADIAMYQAKSGGKDRCALFDQDTDGDALERLDLEGELRQALARGELRLHYQPIVHLQTGEVREVEALVRWEHPRRGLIPPAKFVPIAEETGLILPLGRWVLEEACRQARTWQTLFPNAPPLVMGVNLSTRQFQDTGLVDEVARTLARTGLPATSLKLEITESMMMTSTEAAVDKLHALKDLGVHLAVDDFGTGYSSMAYLSAFPLDTLKIDRSFVSRLGQQSQAAAIVRAIVMLAKALGLQVTSEGIETVEQRALLQALGCDRGQGFLFSGPLTNTAFAALLAASVPNAANPALLRAA